MPNGTAEQARQLGQTAPQSKKKQVASCEMRRKRARAKPAAFRAFHGRGDPLSPRWVAFPRMCLKRIARRSHSFRSVLVGGFLKNVP